MGELKDAIETLGAIKTEFAEAGVYSTKRSISSSAMQGTANFSVLLEDSISLDNGMLITRTCEKKYASFLLTTLTMDPYLEVKKGQTPSASAYLKQFHQNTRIKSPDKGLHISLTDYIKESYDQNDMEYATLESEAFKMAYAIYEGVSRSVPQDRNIQLNYTVQEMTSADILNSRFRTIDPILEAKKPGDHYDNYNDTVELNTQGGNVRMTGDVANVNQNHVDVDATTRFAKDAIHTTNHITVQNSSKDDKPVIPKSNVRDRGSQWKPLTDNDCKKANDLVPTLLHVRVYPIDKYTREELTPIDFIMGVKATLHPLPLAELARMTVSAMRNENMLFNFIRWTTGEIKFFKDFVFALDTLKMDAKDSGKDVTGWRPALKRRRNLSKAKLHLTKNSIMPNATLVISQAGIDYIAETYGYDLSNQRIIKQMMNVYFLLGYATVNQVSQRVSFWFDGIDTSDTYTMDTLKREGSNDDKAFKNMMKMLGRSM